MLDYYYQPEAVNAMLKCKNNGVVVLPTGSGKSHVIQGFCEKFEGRILILSHIKEILEQNFSKLTHLNGIGLYSAGLGVKHLDRITVAGIQSVHPNIEEFKGEFDVVLIDECDLISDEGMYNTVLTKLRLPYLGLTATPFRLKQGFIYGADGMFDSVIYEAKVSVLTKQGYLSKLVYSGSSEEFDMTGVKTVSGDFSLKEMSLKFNKEEVSRQIVNQLKQYATKRKHWLVFCIDIEHAEAVSKLINELGVRCSAVHSKSPRDQTLIDMKAGKLQAVTNVNVLTVGFDFPQIDMIVILRPTKSPRLHAQMLGRGARIADGKVNCLVKDFTSNTKLLGTLAHIQVDKTGKAKKGGKPILKTCPNCDSLLAPVTRFCGCGHEFKFKHNLKLKAHIEAKVEWHDVNKVMYAIHRKPNAPISLKVTYVCGLRLFSEWVLIEHTGFAKQKATQWIHNRWRLEEPRPTNVKDAYSNSSKFWTPSRIRVEEVGKYPKILQVT